MPTDTSQANDIQRTLKWESDVLHSREKVSVLADQNLAVAAVLGKITAGSVPTTGTADVGNTGNGTCTAVTGGVNVQVGTYTITCIQAVAHGGVFEIKDPNSATVGVVAIDPGAGQTGVFTSDEINLTLTDAGTDFVFGDIFTIAVPAGGAQVRAINFAGVDGSANAYGILYEAVDASASGEYTRTFTSGGTYEIVPGDTVTGATSAATARVVAVSLSGGTWAGGDAAGTLTVDTHSGTFVAENLNVGANLNVATIAGAMSAVAATDQDGVAIVRDAEIVSDYLVWPSGATAAQKTAALAQLADKGIVQRTSG
jgi:hypothetical protein